MVQLLLVNLERSPSYPGVGLYVHVLGMGSQTQMPYPIDPRPDPSSHTKSCVDLEAGHLVLCDISIRIDYPNS